MSFIDTQPTKIEYLPVEIFLEIFALFSLEEIANAFYGLNSYIDSIIRCIKSASHTISSNDTKAVELLNLYPNQIGRLFATRGVTIDFTSLINLRSLTIEYGTIAQLDGIRPQHFPMLEVLHIYAVDSNSLTHERKSLADLYQVILSNSFPRLRICTATGIESLDWSETWTGSPTLRILMLDVRTPVAYEKLRSVCPNLRQFKSHSLSLSLSLSNYGGHSKRLLTEIIRLKQWESEKKFILEDCSFFETDKSSTSANNERPAQYVCKTNMPVILGRILPEKDPYCFASFRIKIILPIEYPFKAPEATILDSIYHPNVREGGKHCCCWGFDGETWHPGIRLIGFIMGMIKVIDSIDLDYHCNKILADEYQNNYDRFYEKALQFSCVSYFETKDRPAKTIHARAPAGADDSDQYITTVYLSFTHGISPAAEHLFDLPHQWPSYCGDANTGFTVDPLHGYEVTSDIQGHFRLKLQTPPIRALVDEVTGEFKIKSNWYYNGTRCAKFNPIVFNRSNWQEAKQVDMSFVDYGCCNYVITATGGGYDWQYAPVSFVVYACDGQAGYGCKGKEPCGG